MMKTLTKLPPNVRSFDDPNVREYSFRAVESDANGRLEGIGNKIGELDSYWTVSHPRSRAFSAEGLDNTTSRGYLLEGHDTKRIVGLIESATVQSRDYNLKCLYHSDDVSQRAYKIAKERSDNGKEIGLSIGFIVSNYEYFESGASMVKTLRERGEDLTLFNVEQLNAHTDQCWLMYIDEIFELSQVVLQSNLPSVATSVRNRGESLGRLFAQFTGHGRASGQRFTEAEILKAAREAGIVSEDLASEDPAEIVADVSVEDTERALASIESMITRRRW